MFCAVVNKLSAKSKYINCLFSDARTNSASTTMPTGGPNERLKLMFKPAVNDRGNLFTENNSPRHVQLHLVDSLLSQTSETNIKICSFFCKTILQTAILQLKIHTKLKYFTIK